MNVILKLMNIVHKSCLELKLLPPFDQHYRPMIPPNRGRLGYLTSLGTVMQNNHPICEGSQEKIRGFLFKRR